MITAQRIASLSDDDRRQLAAAFVPRLVDRYLPHTPEPPQQVFLSLQCLEAFYGGAAGGGKSDALLMGALQYMDVPGFSALIVRKSYPDLVLPGAIMDRAKTWLMGTDAIPRDGGMKWIFPSGANLTFGHIYHDKDKYKYQSSEFQYIAFDEVTHFGESTYDYLFSRLRKPSLNCLICQRPVAYSSRLNRWGHKKSSSVTVRCGQAVPDPRAMAEYAAAPDGMTIFDVPLRMRSASNPGGFGHVWVRTRFVDVKTRRPGAIFVPARLVDNPHVAQEEYVESLNHMGAIERERLLNGDWNIEAESGFFRRTWFQIVQDRAPEKAQRVRYWDLAATKDGDWTVGTLVALHEGQVWIEDVVRDRLTPHEVERLVRHTAEMDGVRVRIVMEQEPGSSGLNSIDNYRRKVLVGYRFDGDRVTGDKVARARALSSAAEHGNCKMVAAQWNAAFLDEAVLFPLGEHDDQVDATSGAYNKLALGKRMKVLI